MPVVKALVFVLGMCVCVQLLAAFLGLVDLRYALRRAWPRVARGVVLWTLVTVGLVWALGTLDWYFLAGMIAFLIFWPLTRLGLNFALKRNVKLIERG